MLNGRGRKLAKYLAILRRKSTQLVEPIGHRDIRDGCALPCAKQLLTCACEAHPPHPAERSRPQKPLEMRLKGSRADPCHAGKPFELNRLRHVATQPAKSAHHIGRQ